MHVRKGAGEARAGVDSLQESSFLSSAAALLTRRASLGILWLFVIAYAVRFAAVKLPATPAFNDFNHYYIGGLSLRLGANPYFVNFDTLAQKSGVELGGQDIENQPPTLLLCFKPLASLPPKTGYWLWIAASFASLAVAVWLMLKETSLRLATSTAFRRVVLFVSRRLRAVLFREHAGRNCAAAGADDPLSGARPRSYCGPAARVRNCAQGVSRYIRALPRLPRTSARAGLDGNLGGDYRRADIVAFRARGFLVFAYDRLYNVAQRARDAWLPVDLICRVAAVLARRSGAFAV